MDPDIFRRAFNNVIAFHDHSPEQANAKELLRYQLHLSFSGVAAPDLNAAATALRLFFAATRAGSEITDGMPLVREPRKRCGIAAPSHRDIRARLSGSCSVPISHCCYHWLCRRVQI